MQPAGLPLSTCLRDSPLAELAPSASNQLDFPEVPGYRVLLPESFAGASSQSRELAPSVPPLGGLSPTSHGLYSLSV
jgi:hypothetical protein